MSRFAIAMGLYVVLALLALTTLSDPKVQGVTLLLLAMFAVRTWAHHRRQLMQDRTDREAQLERVKLGRPM